MGEKGTGVKMGWEEGMGIGVRRSRRGGKGNRSKRRAMMKEKKGREE